MKQEEQNTEDFGPVSSIGPVTLKPGELVRAILSEM